MAKCKHCKQSMIGRASKIYCSAVCKSRAHRLSQSKNSYQKKIDDILLRNYKILNSLYTDKKSTTVKTNHMFLAAQGFQFDYCTRIYLNNQGKWYRYVYEYRWMQFSDQKITVYKSKS